MTTIEIGRPEAVAAGSRSQVYALLAQGFRYPSEEWYAAVQGGGYRAAVEAAVAGLPYGLAVGSQLGAGLAESLAELQQEYIALFDVGGPRGAPCFLYEGEFGGGRLKVIEEVLRFYHHFGLQLAQEHGKRDRPDHLATELSFLHALTFKEAELGERGQAVDAYRRAERDFVRVHAGDFLREVAVRVAPRGVPFYSDLAAFGDRFCQAELAYLQSR